MKLRPDCTESACGIGIPHRSTGFICSKCNRVYYKRSIPRKVAVTWEEAGNYALAKQTMEDIKMEIENDKFIFGTGGKI